MDYGTVMLLEDKPNIKVSVTATTSTQAMAAVLSLVVILFRSFRCFKVASLFGICPNRASDKQTQSNVS